MPRHYLCNLDENGLRRDRLERPELHRGSVDFVLPSLSDRTTFEPSFIFLLDVSYNAVISGLLQAGVSSIKGAIAHIFEFVPNARVGVISYDSKIHFYTVKV